MVLFSTPTARFSISRAKPTYTSYSRFFLGVILHFPTGFRLHQHPYRVVFRIFHLRFLQHNAAKELFVFWCCLQLMLAEDFGNEQAISSSEYRLPRPSEHQTLRNSANAIFFVFFRFLLTCCLYVLTHAIVETLIPFVLRQCGVLIVCFIFLLYSHARDL